MSVYLGAEFDDLPASIKACWHPADALPKNSDVISVAIDIDVDDLVSFRLPGRDEVLYTKLRPPSSLNIMHAPRGQPTVFVPILASTPRAVRPRDKL